jgi:pyruvate dehydrogenase E2 component (dihydrolipoamide acetyltransferase)
MYEVIMPKLGLTMESGKIEKWHKKEGDKVEAGDILFEVMTDKVSLEVEAYNSGILRKILRGEEEEVPVTEVVAYIGEKDEEISSGAKASKKPQEKIEEEKEIKPEPAVSRGKEKIKISPLARRIAETKNIDISKIVGTGPRGRIVKEDVEKYIESLSEKKPAGRVKISPLARKIAKDLGVDYKTEPIKGSGPDGRIKKEDIISYAKTKKEAGAKLEREAAAAPAGEMKVKSSTELKGMRKIIAERMSFSKANIPHIVLNAVANATILIDLRERLKDRIASKYSVKITYTDFLLKICAIALKENIEVNSSLQDNNYIIYDDVNVGLAVSVENGLVVPTIYSCDKLDIIDIAKVRTDLVNKAREGKLSLSEISNGTFTLTNLGMFGVRSFSAIINPPQAAILAIGEVYSAPSVAGGKVEIKSFIELSLSTDHRIVDGAMGAKFLQRVVELIGNPEMLFI